MADQGDVVSGASREAVLQYLWSSFAYDVRAARKFLESTLLKVEEGDFASQAGRSTAAVLEECVAQAVEESGGRRLLLPLTGGLDSRSIIAAYLANYRRYSVACCTVGSSNERDVVVTRQVCSSLEVDWIQIQPSDYELDAFQICASLVHSATRSFIGIGSWIMMAPIVALASQDDAIFLTGWGQMNFRDRLAPELSRDDYFFAVARIFAKDRIGPRQANDGIHEALTETASWAQSRLASDCQISPMELLGVAFPLNLRVQANVQGMFVRSAPVFTRPLWMARWFGRRFDERVDKKQWANELSRQHPDVFPRQTMEKRGRFATRVKKAERRLQRIRAANTGSTPSHPSQIDVSVRLVEDVFSALEIPLDVRSALRNGKSYEKVVSLAGHLRAGTLGTQDT